MVPEQPLDDQALSSFAPPHCPWRECPAHAEVFRWHRHGFFTRLDGRGIPRFLCLSCRRTFSSQTFSTSYFMKRPELLAPLAAGLVAGSALRQMARSLGCAPSTATRLGARLGRHALLFASRAWSRLGDVAEPVVYDDFGTFVGAQDFAVGMGTAVGHRSWYVYAVEGAPLRRGGIRTQAQKHRWVSRLRRLVPAGMRQARLRALGCTLDLLTPRLAAGRHLTLLTDGHPDYHRAVARHRWRRRIHHLAFPNPHRGPKGSPRSAVARRRDAALFPVDLLHALLRHSQAHHRRETIAFGRRLNAVLERAWVMAAWRNFIKRQSERRSRAPTPAMVLGLATRPWTWEEVLARRLFPWRECVPDGWQKVYRRDLVTPTAGRNLRHRLVMAY